MHTLVIGARFSGYHIATEALQYGTVGATRRDEASLDSLLAKDIEAVALHVASGTAASESALSAPMQEQWEKTTHLIICSAPVREAPLDDPILQLFMSLPRPPALQWLGYLSTIGVYGDHQGAWVDEQTPCTSKQVRSQMRAEAERGWQALADVWQVPAAVLRLSGIYGPGRNALKDALDGRARMLIKPDQVFNRIHVSDLATAAMKAATLKARGIINVTDDLPAAPQDVIRYAHALAGRDEPEAVDFEQADISAMARSFYSENKRVSNQLSKELLGMKYRYPTYREGLDALWQSLT